jgi:hypothetical protein
MSTDLRQRLQHGADDDDRRDRVEEAAHDQEDEGDEEADADRAHAPGRDVGQQRLRDLVIGQQPAEGAGGADAEQRDRPASLPVSSRAL